MFFDAITSLFASRYGIQEEKLRKEREAFEAHKEDAEKKMIDLVLANTRYDTERLEKLKKDAKELRRVCDLCVLALHDVGMAQLSMELQKEVDKVFGEKK